MVKQSKSDATTALNTALSALSLSSSKTSAPSGVSIAPPTSEHSYFDQFAGFTPNPKAKFDTQFKSLAKFKQWSKAEAAKERTAAILFEFDSLWGTDTSKLDKWQALCEEVGLGNVPGSIKQCKQALGSRQVMVNIVNLIDHRRGVAPLLKFASFAHFREYTMRRPFPREEAKREGFVRALLRKIY